MPTYLYRCANEQCIGEFEEYHSIAIKLEVCPHCEQAGRGLQSLERLINGGGSGRGIVELSAAEMKEAMPGEIAKIKARASRDQNYLANLVGENLFNKNNPRG